MCRVVGFGALLAAPGLAEEPAASVREAFTLGTADLGLRWRFEQVEDDRFAVDARASTLRAALAAKTARFHGLALTVEAEAVVPVGFENDYADGAPPEVTNGVTGRPVIADPELTELQRANLSWARADGALTVTAGRESLSIGDQRFIGPVGWRQNHQAFDGLFASTTLVPRTRVELGFIDEVQRVNGGDLPMASWYLASETTLPAGLTLSVLALELDLDQAVSSGLSTRTLSLALAGRHELEPATLEWRVRFGEQRDAADNPGEIDAAYRELRFGASRGPVTLTLGWELLGAEPGRGRFQTPLATLHAFNGWNDLFLSTPPDGLDDRFVKVVGSHGVWSWEARLHDFRADLGGQRYGRELDAQLGWKAPGAISLLLKGARFESDGFAADVTKLWLMASTTLSIGR